MDSMLLTLWKESLNEISPDRVLPTVSNEAVLYWGKAAQACFEARPPNRGYPYYIVQGEHPIPGLNSFRSGAEILDFFDSLRRMKIKKLRVFLSGGASSMAWLKPASVSEEELRFILMILYMSPLTIQKFNAIRSQYCELKSGGSARWLNKIAPNVHAVVDVMSDVEPFGPQVVGSGPFWDGKVRHRIVSGNSVWVKTISQLANRQKIKILSSSSGQVGEVQRITNQISNLIQRNKQKNGLIVFGTEPNLKVSRGGRRGGRQSHLAGLLLQKFWNLIENEKMEILCASSDGSDGMSGGSSVLLNSQTIKKIQMKNLKAALEKCDTGTLFKRSGALIPAFQSNTNVQGVVLIRMI